MNEPLNIETSLNAAWPIPLVLVILSYAAFLAFVVWIYLTERGQSSKTLRVILALHRFGLLVLIVWMLTGWNLQRTRVDPPELVVAVDISDSMLTSDVALSSSRSKESLSQPQSGNADNALTSSLSNSSAEAIARLSRVEQLLSLDRSQLSSLQQRYRLRLYVMADELIPVDGQDIESMLKKLTQPGAWSCNKDASRLGDCVNRIIQRQSGRGTAAIVLLSDGTNTIGPSLADSGQVARRAAIPIHAILLGRQTEQPDIRITDLLCEDQVYFGDRVTVDATVAASELATQDVTVRVLDSETGTELDQKSVLLGSTMGQQTVQLAFTPEKAGLLNLRVTTEPLPGEANVVNNSAAHSIKIENRQIRVLLVFGGPSYEFRFLKHLLERSSENNSGSKAPKVASFQTSSILQDGDLDYVLQDSTARRFVPTDSSELAEYDAFVFGAFDPNIIPRSSQQAIVRAVTEGGAGCVFVGPDANFIRRLQGTPLASLLPIDSVELAMQSGDFRIAPTKLGENSLLLQGIKNNAGSFGSIDRLPRFQSVLKPGKLKPGAQLLAQAEDGTGAEIPLLVTQFAGAGRSLLLGTDETYRWTGVYGSDSIHQTFWGSTLRWVSRGKLLTTNQPELLIEPKQATVSSPIRIRLRLPSGGELPETADIRITGSDGAHRQQSLQRLAGSLNIYQSSMDQLTAGSYRAVLTSPTYSSPAAADFAVLAPPGESANLRADVDAMKQVAELSRGKYYDEASASRWLNELPAGRPVRLGSLPPQAIWNSPWVALLFIGVITSEWLMRRRARLH